MNQTPGIVGLTLLALMGIAGCVSEARHVQLEPQLRQIRYEKEFAQASAGPAADGGYDLVMTNGISSTSTQYGTRIFPSKMAPLAEILHIHVSWRPPRSSKSDFPAATNATIQWYVISNDPQSPGYIEYQGIGFVKVIVEKKNTTFYLEDLTVKVHKIVGNMKDPLGPTRLHGICDARNNALAVRDTLQALDAQLCACAPSCPLPATEPAGMAPARTNVGP